MFVKVVKDGQRVAFSYADYFTAERFFPTFFTTVACGILSGFHATQTAIISRTMKNERQGRGTFYNMMVLEGFIAMVWAAAAMGAYNNVAVAAAAYLAVLLWYGSRRAARNGGMLSLDNDRLPC